MVLGTLLVKISIGKSYKLFTKRNIKLLLHKADEVSFMYFSKEALAAQFIEFGTIPQRFCSGCSEIDKIILHPSWAELLTAVSLLRSPLFNLHNEHIIDIFNRTDFITGCTYNIIISLSKYIFYWILIHWRVCCTCVHGISPY